MINYFKIKKLINLLIILKLYNNNKMIRKTNKNNFNNYQIN